MKKKIIPATSFESFLPKSILEKLDKKDLVYLKRFEHYPTRDPNFRTQQPGADWLFNYTLLFVLTPNFKKKMKDKEFLSNNGIQRFWHQNPQVLIRMLLYFGSVPQDAPLINKHTFMVHFGPSYWRVNGRTMLRYGWITRSHNNYYRISIKGKKLLENLKISIERDAISHFNQHAKSYPRSI
jgi:hypothetical protein